MNETSTGHRFPHRGILLIALGDPMYGRMAANMVASLRCAEPELPVHLVWQGRSISHLSADQRALFTSMAQCPPEYYTKNGKEVFIKAKTCIYELSPFDETIFLDVDLLLFDKRPVSVLFNELAGVDFTMQNRGYTDLGNETLNESYNIWANIKQVKEAYNTTGRYYQLASEFIYFKRTEANRKFFALVRQIFDKPLIDGKLFNGDLPDEFAYDIATAVLGHYPHKDNFVVIYWWALEKYMAVADIMKNYYGYSMGGNHYPDYVAKQYESMGRYYAKHAGVAFQKVLPKRSWNAARIKI